MIKSMTGYARISKVFTFGRGVLELHCVNKRTLEMNVNLPRSCLYYDLLLREWVRREISRGQVTIRFHIEREERTALPSTKGLKDAKSYWVKVAKSLGFDPAEGVTLPFLLQQVSTMASEDLSEKQLKEMTIEALSALKKMKENEGAALEKDLLNCLAKMGKILYVIEKGASRAVKRFEERLREKIKEYHTSDFDEKIAREVVLYADKVDVNEEIVRLRSHFDQFASYLKSKEKSTGRTLEFLTQEIHRELNTLSSKVAECDLIHKAVQMKNELGKMREQVQNIE